MAATTEEVLEQLTEDLAAGIVRREEGVCVAVIVPAASFRVTDKHGDTQTFHAASEAAKCYLEHRKKQRGAETAS